MMITVAVGIVCFIAGLLAGVLGDLRDVRDVLMRQRALHPEHAAMYDAVERDLFGE